MAIYNGIPSGGARAGAAGATIDGEAIDVAGDCTYDVTTVKRETLLGQSGVQDYSEMPKPGMISFTARDAREMSVAAFMRLTRASIVVQLVSGKSVSGDNMWCVDCQPVKTADGTFEVKFEGRKVVES